MKIKVNENLVLKFRKSVNNEEDFVTTYLGNRIVYTVQDKEVWRREGEDGAVRDYKRQHYLSVNNVYLVWAEKDFSSITKSLSNFIDLLKSKANSVKFITEKISLTKAELKQIFMTEEN